MNIKSALITILKLLIYAVALNLLVILAYQYQPDQKIEFGHGLDRLFLNNVYPRQNKIEGESYRRIRSVSHLFLPYTGSNLHYRFTFRVRSLAAEKVPFAIYTNKKKMISGSVSNEPVDITYEFTKGKIEADYLLFHLVNEKEKGKSFKPIFLKSIEIKPIKHAFLILPSVDLLLKLSAIIIILTAAARLITRKSGVWMAAGLSTAIFLILLFKRFYLLVFIDMLLVISLLTLGLTLAARFLIPLLLRKISLNPGLSTFRILLLIIAAGFFVRAVIWYYPGTISSDIDFHAHRMAALYEDGKFLQTSTTPDGSYKFPYPTLLYILLAPLRWAAGFDYQHLIKAGLIFFDSLIPLLLFLICYKVIRDENAAIIAAGLYMLFPLTMYKFMWGISTEIFALFAAWLFIALLAYKYRHLHKLKMILFPAAAFTVVLLSHFGTAIEITLFMGILIIGYYLAYSNKKNNRRIVGLILIVLIGLTAAFFVYYINYLDLIKEQAHNVLRSTFSGEGNVTRNRLKMLIRGWNSIKEYIGLPLALILPFSYAAYIDRRRRTAGFVLITSVIVTSLAFLAISIVSPLDVRWLLFTLPAISLINGYALSRLMRARTGRLVFVIILILSAVFAASSWYEIMFDGPYHKLF